MQQTCFSLVNEETLSKSVFVRIFQLIVNQIIMLTWFEPLRLVNMHWRAERTEESTRNRALYRHCATCDRTAQLHIT